MKKLAGCFLIAFSVTAAETKPPALPSAPFPAATARPGALAIPLALQSEAARHRNARIGALGGLQALRTKLDQSEKARINAKNTAVRTRLASILATPPPPGCPKPTIQAVLSDSPVSPGQEIVLNGCGFGTPRPHVRLMGQFPGGFLELQLVPPWRDDVIIATVPATSGVMDQPATITVLRSDLTIGNQVPLGFQASRSVYWLSSDDVVAACAKPGGCAPLAIPDGTVPGTIGAFHQVDQSQPWIGVDTVGVHLINGWSLYDYSYASADGLSHSDLAFASPPTGFTAGASSANISVVSTLMGRSGIRWNIFLYAVGPTGVPPR